MAIKPCKETKTPFIIFPHGSEIEYTLKCDERFLKFGEEAIVACTALITGNREVANRIITLYPDLKDLIENKLDIVGVGVDTSLFESIAKDSRASSIQQMIKKLKADLGEKSPENVKDFHHPKPDIETEQILNRIPWKENILLFVGSLTVGKGLQTLITSMPEILEAHPHTHLLIVGSGSYRKVLEALVYAISKSDFSLLKKLSSLGKDLDKNDLTGPWEDVQVYLQDEKNIEKIQSQGKILNDHVHFLGRLTHEYLSYLFPCADIAVFPSIIPEAYPLVLMESLSNGVLPAVSYFSGFKDGIDEILPELGADLVNQLKISVDPSVRVKDCISKINQLLSLISMHDYSEELRTVAVNHYDWNIRANELTKAFKKTLFRL